MSILFPGFLIAAGIAAAVVAGLHFLATREARTDIFPTVRFMPQAQMRSTALAVKLTDFLLLLLRIAIVLLIGIALAQPRFALPKEKLSTIVAVDVSRAVQRNDVWRDLVRAHSTGAAAVIAFDCVAREITQEELDSTMSAPSSARGSLSAGLIAALRTAARLRERAEALDLVLISPLVAEQRDAATLSIRSLWPGRVTLVRPQAARLALSPERSADRTHPPLVEWADTAPSDLWIERSQVNIIGGIRAGSATMIFPFERRWQLKPAADENVRVFARWIDGEPAAVERFASGAQECTRSIGFSWPKAGDATLRPDFVRFMNGLSAVCGETPDFLPLTQTFVSDLAGRGGVVDSAAMRPQTRRTTWLAPCLLSIALVLMVLEYPVRRWSDARRSAA